MGKLVLLILALLQYYVIFTSVMAVGTMDDINNLKNLLFRNYNRHIRPVYNLSDSVEIDTLFSLFSILDFDEVTGTLTMSTGLTLTWFDFRLAWNSSKFGGVTQHGFSSALVWKPTIVMISSAEEYQDYGSYKFDVRVSSDGQVKFTPGKIVKATCKVDMTSFPSDSHMCSVNILPWVYFVNEVALTPNRSEIFMNYFWPSKEWEVDRTYVSRDNRFSQYGTVLGHDIFLTRKSRYFMMSLVTPIILLCFLNPFVFLLPVSSGERVSFAVTIFLSLAVYMSYIGQELLPKVSDPIPGASCFLLAAMSFSCLLIILTVLRLRYVDVHNVQEFPCWLTVFVKIWIYRRKCRKTHRIRPTGRGAKIVKEETAKENSDDMDIAKDDIKMISRFIDKFLFWITEILMVIAVIAFDEIFGIKTVV